MRFMPVPIKRAEGFTLIEVLIIAPIILIIVSGFIALMITMVGDVLQTRDRNALTYDTQYSLDRIEQDTHLSTRFLSTTGTLTSPQGSDSNFTGTAAFTSGANTLIFNQPATDGDPTSPSRRLLYYAMQPNACGSTESFNRIFTQKVVYFIKSGSLWRRTLVPDWNTNSPPDSNTICNDYAINGRPWGRNTCSPGYTATRCETNDEEIMQNIDSFTTKYYTTPGGTNDIGASNADKAVAIETTINSSKTTAGRPYSTTSTTRATKINTLDTDVQTMETPVVSNTLSLTDQVTFSWSPVLGTVTYNVFYNINGGSWNSASVGSGTTSYDVQADHGDTITFKVSATGTTGTSGEGTSTATIPVWASFDLMNGWTDYSATVTTTSYAKHAFTRTRDKIVILRGTIKDGTATTDTQIGTLPVGYRPSKRLIFTVATSNGAQGQPARVDVWPDGKITIREADAGWIDLDGIAFVPSGTSYSWITPTYANGWQDYGGTTFAPAKATITSSGLVYTEGLALPGTIASGTTIASMAAAYRPSSSLLLSSRGNANAYVQLGVNSTAGLYSRGSDVTYLSLQSLYYPSSFAGWTNLTPQNSWVYYGSPFSTVQYAKSSEGMVIVKGLIKSGTTTAGTVVATLPAGYRPSERLIFVSNSGGTYGRFDINQDGTIVIKVGSSAWMSLDAIHFFPDQ